LPTTEAGRRPHRMLPIASVAMLLAKLYSYSEKPDPYAAAICIRVRLGCLLRG